MANRRMAGRRSFHGPLFRPSAENVEALAIPSRPWPLLMRRLPIHELASSQHFDEIISVGWILIRWNIERDLNVFDAAASIFLENDSKPVWNVVMVCR